MYFRRRPFPNAATRLGQLLSGSSIPQGRQEARRLLLYVAAQSSNYALLIGADAVISRSLGPEQRGLWFGYHALMLMMAGVLSFGLPVSAYYFVGTRRIGLDRVNSTFAAVLGVSLLPLLGAGVAIGWRLGTAAWISNGLLWGAITATLVCIEIYVLCWYSMIMSLRALKVVALTNNVSSAMFLLTVLGAARWFRLDLLAVLSCYFAYRLFFVGLIVFSLHRGGHLRFRPDLSLAREMFWFGTQAQLGNLFALGLTRTIFFYVYHLRGAYALGLFGVAFGLTERLGYLTNAIQFVFTRDILRDELPKSRQRTFRIVRAMLAFYFLLMIPLWAAANILVPAFYGPAFRGTLPVFYILTIGAFFHSATQVQGIYINGRLGRPVINSAIAIVNFLLAATVGYLAVVTWGMLGAASVLSAASAFHFCAAATAGAFATERPGAMQSGQPVGDRV